MTLKSAIYVVLLVAAILLFFRYLIPFMLPFIIGVLLAFILDPIVSVLSKKAGLSRARSALVTITFILVMLVLLFTWAITRVVEEATALYGRLPLYYDEFNRVVAEVLRVVGDISQQMPEPIARAAQEQWNKLSTFVASVVAGAGGIVTGVPVFVVMLMFTMLSAYFVMRDRAQIAAFMKTLVPANAFESVKHVELDILGGVAGFVRAQALLVVLTMVVNVLALTLLGSRYAVALGILLAVIDILPVVGPGLIYLPWILYQAIWGSAGMAIGLAVLYGAVSILRQVAQTHLVGREFGLHPLATLLSLYAGYRLFGAAGLLYGPFTALIVKGLWVSGLIPHEDGGPA